MSNRTKNLDVYLAEIFKQFVALKDDDLKKSLEVFNSVFEQMKQTMREQCNYFNRYASQIMYAGSVYDGVKVSKLDEFDLNIVIRLPISYEDGDNGIIIENDKPGFVRMKITKPFDNLDKQPEWETHHKVTRDWRDSEKYLLQNKFRQWIHSIVQKAVNQLNGRVDVNGVQYSVTYRMSGPAYTLNVRQARQGDDDFTLDVDLVPVIRFMVPRWPAGYRCLEGSKVKDWLVVPKPNKSTPEDILRSRGWRLSFQEFEKEMMKGCQQLKTIIRLVKKLRDALGMKAIASYYIKTLFLWKISKTDKKHWETKLSTSFRNMVQELHDAIVNKNIPYFWNEKNNLIDGMKPTIQKVYAEKLNAVLISIQNNDVDKVVSYLLTAEELKMFKKSKFYGSMVSVTSSCSPSNSFSSVSRQVSRVEDGAAVESDNQTLSSLVHLVKNLTQKIDSLSDKILNLEDRLMKLEMEKKTKNTDASTGDLNNISFSVNSMSLQGVQQSESISLVNLQPDFQCVYLDHRI